MTWHRRFRVLGLALALSAALSCSTDGGAPTEAAPDVAPHASAEQPSQLLGGLLGGDGLLGGVGEVVDGTLGTVSGLTDLLTCSPQPYAVTTKTVGPNGGTIVVGEHVLEIPRGALSNSVTIRAEQVPGSVNSLRFSPEGLQFAKPAQLTMSYRNCLLVLLPKRIAYTTEGLQVLELLKSRDAARNKTVTGPVDHFSRYAVAY